MLFYCQFIVENILLQTQSDALSNLVEVVGVIHAVDLDKAFVLGDESS
jgi:hypothetical protein